jgi:hypothetical protein
MIKALTNWLGRLRNPAGKLIEVKEPTTTRRGPIEFSPSQREQVERRLAEFLEDSAAIYEHARRAAVRSQALPLFLGDWTGVIAPRLNGEVIWVPDEGEPGDIEVIEDERLRNLGLFQGTKLHPNLAFLVPEPPPDASDLPGLWRDREADVPSRLGTSLRENPL